MAHEVFVSYSHKDKSIADAIVNHLENEGKRCWYAPRDIEPGSDWAASIIAAIKSAKVMVLVFTEDSNISRQVLREVSNAVSAGLPIIPMKLTAQEPSEGMQYYLSAVHWLDAVDCETEAAIGKLAQKVDAVMNAEDYVAPQDYRTTVKQGKKSKGLIIGLVAVLLAAAGIGGFLLKGGGAPKTDPDVAVAIKTDDRLSIENPNNSYTQGNMQCNMINGGIACSDDNYIYYRSNDGFSLYKMRKNGSEQEQVLAEPVSYLALYEGFIYFYSQVDNPYIGRYDLESGRVDTLFPGRIENMRVANDRVYFLNGDDNLYLYSMDLNGGSPKQENSVPELYKYMIAGDYIYYIKNSDGKKLYRISMDGTEYQKMTDCACDSAIICEDYIIYDNLDTSTLDALNIKDFKNYTIANGWYTDLTVSGYGITGVNNFGTHYLARFSLNKLAEETLAQKDVTQCCQLDGLVVCRDKETKKYFARTMSGGSEISFD